MIQCRVRKFIQGKPALGAAELKTPDLPQGAATHPHAPQHCTVGQGYYFTSNQRISTLRIRVGWIEQLGSTIGTKLPIRLRNGDLIVSVTSPSDKATDSKGGSN